MALQGVKVVELAGLAPAPFCGKILSDFGASVLRVDKIGSNTNYDCLANGKQSIAINLKDAKGVQLLRELCKNSDVLLEPFRKGVMESLGLGPQVLLKENPRLIYARLTGYGQSGAYSKKAGHDINYVALSGLLSLFGRKNAKPTFPVNFAADFAGGGLTCALGIILALYNREKTNLGQIVDSGMVHGTAYLGSWLYRSQRLPLWGNKRGENVLDTGSHYYNVYETKDGKYLSVGALEFQFYEELLKGLNLEFEDNPQIDPTGKTEKKFNEIFKTKTLDEWLHVFKDLDACVAPVLTLQEAAKHTHNAEENNFMKEDDQLYPSPAPKLSRTPGIITERKAPRRGEHTAVFLKQLGYTENEIQALENQGIIEIYKPSKL